MKKTISALLTLILCWGGFTAAFAADNSNSASLLNFRLGNTYINNSFSDVNEASWYGTKQQAVIKRAVDLGIMNGMGNGAFYPDSNIKISEAVKMAAVVHSIYNGDNASFTAAGKPWYQGYVDYALSNGIISAGAIKDYNAYATRTQMVYIFAHTLPASELKQINTVNSLPDVTNSTPNSSYIYSLYRAGVLTGDAGTRAYRPDSNISRAEAAAIIARIVLPSERQHFEILPHNADLKSHGPEYAIYNDSGISLALGYQSAEVLKTFFNTGPATTDKYGFTDGANLYIPHYQGIGSVRYLLSDFSAGGIYVFDINITSANYKLANGIHVGSTPLELQAAYGNKLQFSAAQVGGDGAFQPSDAYIYYPGDKSPWGQIHFEMINGVVSEIEFNCSVY